MQTEVLLINWEIPMPVLYQTNLETASFQLFLDSLQINFIHLSFCKLAGISQGTVEREQSVAP